MSLIVTEINEGGIREKQILYFCNIGAHKPKTFMKCYFDAYFIS
jgi:hypothetical protein